MDEEELGLPFGPKKTGKTSIFIEDLLRNQFFFETVGKPKGEYTQKERRHVENKHIAKGHFVNRHFAKEHFFVLGRSVGADAW